MSDYENITPDDLAESVVVKLYPDEDSRNPRHEYDHAGTFVVDHRDYDLSDKDANLPTANGYYSERDVADRIRFAQRYVELIEKGIAIPVYLADYGSGQARIYETDAASANGMIWITGAEIQEGWTAYGTPDPRDAARRCLLAEIEELDQYLQGDVYGYVIETPDGDTLDSCWGFYGEKYAREEALSAARYCAERERTDALEAARQGIPTTKEA